MLPIAALRYDAAVSLFEPFLRVTNSREFKDPVNHSLTDIQNASLSATRPFASSWLPVADQCVRSNVFIAYLPPAPSLDGIADWVAEWLEEELERKMWESLEDDNWTLLSNECERYCYGIQRNDKFASCSVKHQLPKKSRAALP